MMLNKQPWSNWSRKVMNSQSGSTWICPKLLSPSLPIPGKGETQDHHPDGTQNLSLVIMCHPNHPIGMETKKQNTSKYLNILNIYNIYIYHWIGLREMLQESSTNLMGKTGKTMAGSWYKIGSSSQLLGKTKNVPNHQPVQQYSNNKLMVCTPHLW